jgi:hypothetical protein
MSAELKEPTLQDQLPLANQAFGLERAEVMKMVVGPVLTSLLQPVYEVDDTVAEHACNYARMNTLGDAVDFVTFLRDNLLNKLSSHLYKNREIEDEIDELGRLRPDLFFFNTARGIIQEGVITGIATPFQVATHIERLERGVGGQSGSDDDVFYQKETLEILKRESVGKILGRLTKGPNGFLGGESSSIVSNLLYGPFFDFSDYSNARFKIEDAYKIEDGKVVDLSDAYSLIANRQRQKIEKDYANPDRVGPYQGANSSGCPVRHRFRDETGELQDSLITTGKNFLIAAIELVPDI